MKNNLKTFEIHITGKKSIINEFNNLKIKNIIVELLKPDNSLLRIEYMSSFIKKKNLIQYMNVEIM